MKNSPFSQPPSVLVALTLVAFLGALLSREASIEEGLPAFFLKNKADLYVELTGDVASSGVYQLSDGVMLCDVIKLTGLSVPTDMFESKVCEELLHSGELLQLGGKGTKVASLQRGWMPAAHRLALGIRLHPDRMSLVDWQVLPGIGPILAERIAQNRQSNGDFGRLEAVERVRGVGPKRIKSWKGFF